MRHCVMRHQRHQLGYQPEATQYWPPPRTVIVVIAVVCMTALLLFIWKHAVVYPPSYKRWLKERDAFDELGALAYQMIEQRAQGVVEVAGVPCISSFDSYMEYIKQRRPHWRVTPDAPNPLPTILPGRSYDRMAGPATQPSDILISGTEVFRYTSSSRHYRLACDAEILDNEGESLGTKVPSISRVRPLGSP